MSTHEVVVISGDGIGQEVTPAAREVLEEFALDIEFIEANAGDNVRAETGVALPRETEELVVSADATLFGAVGDSVTDVVIPLRQAIDSFVNVRPAKAHPGVDALRPETDLVILRENSEGVYAGLETRLTDEVATLTRPITKQATRRLAEYACTFVENQGTDRLTLVHKANVMRETDGLFRNTVLEVTDERGVETDEVLMDAFATRVCLDPTQFDVAVCPNLAGDVLSDLAAGLVGGLGLLPSANIGPENGLFEPVHGSAPDIAGEGIANPSAAILSGAMLLEFLGHNEPANQVRSAVESVLESGPRTPDLGGESSTAEMTEGIIARLN